MTHIEMTVPSEIAFGDAGYAAPREKKSRRIIPQGLALPLIATLWLGSWAVFVAPIYAVTLLF